MNYVVTIVFLLSYLVRSCCSADKNSKLKIFKDSKCDDIANTYLQVGSYFQCLQRCRRKFGADNVSVFNYKDGVCECFKDSCAFVQYSVGWNMYTKLPKSIILEKYSYGDDGLYYALYIDQPSTKWTEAEEICAKEGATLPMIKTEKTHEYIRTKYGGILMMGASDRLTEGTWKWLDGSDVNFNKWYQGEPNNAGGVEDCSVTSKGAWNDVGCWYASTVFLFQRNDNIQTKD